MLLGLISRCDHNGGMSDVHKAIKSGDARDLLNRVARMTFLYVPRLEREVLELIALRAISYTHAHGGKKAGYWLMITDRGLAFAHALKTN